jgi:hypothetical protein
LQTGRGCEGKKKALPAFGAFLKEYEDFVKGLGETRQTFYGLPYSFVHPKPL